jgi:hypothetical protein
MSISFSSRAIIPEFVSLRANVVFRLQAGDISISVRKKQDFQNADDITIHKKALMVRLL